MKKFLVVGALFLSCISLQGATVDPSEICAPKDGYTINFNNVSIIEYIRFVSKISNTNFVFDDQELNFNVTIISEEPISTKNIMSALMQILRMHNLTLLEQDNNLLITKSKEISQMSTLVTGDKPNENPCKSAIITRVFRIKNSNVATVAGIIKPLTSASALIEVSVETRQLIVTDITTNVDKIAELLITIDTPHSILEIESYQVTTLAPTDLVPLAMKILAPFIEGNPFNMVPLPDTHTVFIVSTPNLIERAMTVLEDLDVPAKERIPSHQVENIFIYQVKNTSIAQILSTINKTREDLAIRGNAQPDFMAALKTVTPIESSNSLMFVGDDATLEKIKAMMQTLDVASPTHGPADTFYLYKLHHVQGNFVESHLKALAEKLQSPGRSNASLIATIDKIKWIQDSNSLLITGSAENIEEIKSLIDSLDVISPSSTDTFYLYKLQYVQGSFIESHLKIVAEKLKASGHTNASLILAIGRTKWIKEGNSLLITGTPDNIDEIKKLIVDWDVASAPGAINIAGEKTSFFIYKPVYRTAHELQTSIGNTAIDMEESGLIDKELFQTLGSVRYVASTNSLLFTGTPESISKLQALLTSLDSPGDAAIQTLGETTFLIYKPLHVSGTQLMASLKKIAGDLETKHADPDLAAAIESMKWVAETGSILFIGTEATLKKIETLTHQFDVGTSTAPVVAAPETYVIYTPTYVNGETLIETLCEFGQHLKDSGIQDKNLYDAINNLRWIEKTCSLLISGTQASITKIQELLQRFDVASGDSVASTTINPIDNTNFLVYKLQYHPGDQLQVALKQVATDLAATGTPLNQELAKASQSLQWIKMTNSLLATGKSEVLTKLRDLIQNLDVPLRQVFIEVLIIQTSLNNGQTFGLQWGGNVKFLNKFSATANNQAGVNTATLAPNSFSQPLLNSLNGMKGEATGVPVPAVQGPASSGFDLGVIGDIIMHKGSSFLTLGSLVNALQTDFDSTIVMNPKILTQDNQNATIFVGTNNPYVGSVVQVTGTSVSTNTNLEYRDVGVNLSITPYLGNGDLVTLTINTSISAITGQASIANSSVSGITTSQTNMTTQVHVPNDKFLVLSGMVQDTKDHFKSGLPCLGGLPVIGFAFSENDRSDLKNNVIIFVRPHIIDTFDDYKKVTENQENLFREQAGLPILREYFDAGLDLVKTPEDE